MPIQKAHAAFGYVLIRNDYADGEVIEATVKSDFAFTTYWAKGAFQNFNVSTGLDWVDFPTGHILRPGDYVGGVFRHTAVGETVVFCHDPALNRNYTPDIDVWSLDAQAQVVLPVGTRLFLCSGSLLIEGRKFDEPVQITIKSEDKIAVAESKCYGLLFR
jgi:hypothetical protein